MADATEDELQDQDDLSVARARDHFDTGVRYSLDDLIRALDVDLR